MAKGAIRQEAFWDRIMKENVNVKTVVETHEGTISVKSKIKKGAEFIVKVLKE